MYLSAEPLVGHHGVGGLIGDPGQVDRVWLRLRSEYRRQLASLRYDLPITQLIDNERRQLAVAGELALRRGGLATSRFITIGMLGNSVKQMAERLITPDLIIDPFVGVRVRRLSPTSLAWDTTCPASVIEESPLFEAILHGCEQVHWNPGHGAVLEITGPGETPELIWATGHGAQLIGRSHTAHIYR